MGVEPSWAIASLAAMVAIGLLVCRWDRQRCGPGVLAETAKQQALAVLERHGFQAHYYMAAIGLKDRELADACRRLCASGFIITSKGGGMVGKTATVLSSHDEQVATRRASIRLVSRKLKGEQ